MEISSCCVDEVAAAHADCTALVHFGEACHSAPTDKIDVKYVEAKKISKKKLE